MVYLERWGRELTAIFYYVMSFGLLSELPSSDLLLDQRNLVILCDIVRKELSPGLYVLGFMMSF